MKDQDKISRSNFVDFIKGYAILLVVLGHSIQYGNGTDYVLGGLFFDNIIFKIIYSFHMPLFMLISGYLFYFSLTKKNIIELIIARFKSLIVPIISWGVIINLILLYYNRNFDIYQFYSIWFLWAILFNSLLIIVINKFFKDNIMIYIFILIIMFIIPDNFNLGLYKYMYPYFLLGYLFNKTLITKKIDINKVIIFSFILYVPLMFFWNKLSYIYVSGINVFGELSIGNQVLIDIYRWVVGGIGSILFIALLKKIYNKNMFGERISKFFEKAGKNSLGIYIISSYIFIYFFPKYIYSIKIDNIIINAIYILLITIAMLTSSYFITLLISKVKILNILLLGNR